MFNLSDVLKKPLTKRGRVAINLLRMKIARETKRSPEQVVIDSVVNESFSNLKKPVRKIRLKIVTDDNKVYVLPPEKELIKPEAKKEEKKGVVESIVGKKEEKMETKNEEPKGKESKEEKKPEQPKPKFDQKTVEAGKK